MFGSSVVPNIQELYFERWATNPLHYGSFSTWPVGADRPADARERLAAHVGRVFFAQDATDTAIGTVSGSVSAGERAAKQIIRCVNGRNCPRAYKPVNTGGRPRGCANSNLNNNGGNPNSGSRCLLQPLTMIFASILSFALTSIM